MTVTDKIAEILDKDRKWPDAKETAEAIVAALSGVIPEFPVCTNAELKPCPFCGGRARIELCKITRCQLHGDPSQAVRVHCFHKFCHARPSVLAGDIFNGGYDKAKNEAIAAWNTRAEPKVKPLDFPERRHGYWGHKSGYQIAYTAVDNYRVRLHGKVICRDINGFDRAVGWANNHNTRRILGALE